MLKLELIRTDGGTQTRAAISQDAVSDYADAVQAGTKLPPVTVFHDGSTYWLADGFHRYEAAKRLEAIEIDADVKQGERRDAVLYSVGANATHGLRRTNEDKRRAVALLLEDAEWSQWSDREIAKRAGVGNKFVGDTRRAICVPNTDERKVKRGDSEYTMQVAQPKVEAPKTDYTAPRFVKTYNPPRLPDPAEEDELPDEPEARAELVHVEIAETASRLMPEETPYTRTQAHMESDGFKRAEFLRKHIVPLATLPEGQLSEDLQLPDSVALRLPNFMKTIIREVAA